MDGVEAVVMNYYRHIDRTKIQFDFICDEDSTNIPYDEIKELGGRVILVPPYQKIFKYHNELKKVLKEGNYKIVHSHLNTLSVFSLFAAKCAGIPVRIAHSHSTTSKSEKKKNILKQVLRPFSKVFATDYMCCSEVAGRWLFGNKEYDKGNVYLLNNAIDLDKFKYDEKVKEEIRRELNILKDTLVIGHVGRFVETKNHKFLIDIFKKIHNKNSDSILLLVGQGPLMNEIKEKVRKLGLENCVKFLGQRNDVNKLYNVMDVFCLPSLYEGLPVVGVEAQANGLLCMFADTMTKESKVLESTKFMSLENDANEWNECILNELKKFTRKTSIEEMTANKFNIKHEAQHLEKYYISKNTNTVLHIINSKMFSGLESVACDIIQNVKSFNHVYVTQKGPILDILEERNIKYEIIEKMSIREIKRVTKKYKAKIIHAHDFTASVICALANTKVSLISHLHNNSPWLKKFSFKSIAFLYAGLKADKILTVSESIQKEYIFSKFINDKIECIGNPISRDKILSKVSENDYKKKYDICCVARITTQKNPYKFLEIINEIKKDRPNIKAIWVGDGDLKDNVLERVVELKLNKNIEFVGFQKNPYMYMAKSKIFMLTSDWEGFGLVAFEALTLGLPCVVSNVGGLSEIVDESCGAVCENDLEFISEIRELLLNENYYDSKNIYALKKSGRIENIDKYMNTMCQIYTRRR